MGFALPLFRFEPPLQFPSIVAAVNFCEWRFEANVTFTFENGLYKPPAPSERPCTSNQLRLSARAYGGAGRPANFAYVTFTDMQPVPLPVSKEGQHKERPQRSEETTAITNYRAARNSASL